MTGKNYWVYILASKKNGTIYVGITNSLETRAWQHKRNFGRIHEAVWGNAVVFRAVP